MNETEIIKGCQERDAKAQFALVSRYSGLLMTTARRYARRNDEAQDILQNSFIKILAAMPRFQQGVGSFEGWMRRIVVNVALQTLRQPLHFSTEAIPHLHELPDADPEVYQQMNTDHLLHLIGELPDGCRTVFNLFVLEQFSHREIADMLGIDESTSRSQLTRARALLRCKLDKIQPVNPKLI
jgi:RNA polymerase sigma factor (sigma-70 family)